MKHINLRTIFLIVTAFALTACGGGTETPDNGKINVVATTGQIGDALANIGGDAINLTSLLGPGIDPHLYVPTESNLGTFANADLIVYNGLHLEAQMLRALEQMEQRGIVVVEIGAAIPEDQLITDTSAGGTHDPHIWNSAPRWSMGLRAVTEALQQVDPDNAEVYQQNSERYLEEIAATDAYIRAELEKVPADIRIMITAHDAFAYYADEYGVEVAGLQGISTESEASTADVQALAAFIADNKLPAIFVESSVPVRTIESVKEASRALGHEVEIGGELFSDALAEEGHPAATYIGMMRYNIDTFVAAMTNN